MQDLAGQLGLFAPPGEGDPGPFQSAAQAVRPIRNGQIPMKLEIKIGRRVCVRMVTVGGECYQLDVEPVADAAHGL